MTFLQTISKILITFKGKLNKAKFHNWECKQMKKRCRLRGMWALPRRTSILKRLATPSLSVRCSF